MKKDDKPYAESRNNATSTYAATNSALATSSDQAKGGRGSNKATNGAGSNNGNQGKNKSASGQAASDEWQGPVYQPNKSKEPNSTEEPNNNSDATKYPSHEYENLVFEGGGVRGLAYVGALNAFEQYYGAENGIKPIKRVAGASAGAITAMLIALGYRGQDLLNIARNVDFMSFILSKETTDRAIDIAFDEVMSSLAQTASSSLIGGVGLIALIARNLVKYVMRMGSAVADIAFLHTGLFSKNAVKRWLAKAFEEKQLNIDLTFAELHDLTQRDNQYKDLYVAVSNLSTNESLYFSYEKTPNVQILQAVSYSMAFPFVFEAGTVVLEGEADELTLTEVAPDHPDAQLLSDGGIFDNYPVALFDSQDDQVNQKTLGFRLDTPEEIARYYEGVRNKPNHIQGLSGLLFSFLNDIPFKAQIERFLKNNDHTRSVFINTKDISATDFNMKEPEKRSLLISGWFAFANFTGQELIPTDGDITEAEIREFANRSDPNMQGRPSGDDNDQGADSDNDRGGFEKVMP